MSKKLSLRCAAGVALALASVAAVAHVGVVNTQLPYAVAGKTYELVLAVPHGCAYTPASGVATELDTYKVEVIVPAGFTGVRPIIDGAFGKPALTRDAAGLVAKMVWTKPAALDSSADDQSYRVALRGTLPNAPFTTLQFNTKQYCKDPSGGADVVRDWASYTATDGSVSNQSPKVKIFPARTPGWNKFNLAATNEKHTPADVKAFLADFFADAQIVWLQPGTNTGKGVYSVNPATVTKIKALAAKDSGTYEIVNRADVMIHASDDLWVKY